METREQPGISPNPQKQPKEAYIYFAGKAKKLEDIWPDGWMCTCKIINHVLDEKCQACGRAQEDEGVEHVSIQDGIDAGKLVWVSSYAPFFTGTYNTIFDIFHDGCHDDDEMLEGMEYYRDFDYDNAAADRDMLHGLCQWMLEFDEFGVVASQPEQMWHPKEYNFLTDRADLRVLMDKAKFKAAVDKLVAEDPETCSKYFEDKFRSRSGFISFWEHDLEYWQDAAGWLNDSDRGSNASSHAIPCWLTLLKIVDKDPYGKGDFWEEAHDIEMQCYETACRDMYASGYIIPKSARLQTLFDYGCHEDSSLGIAQSIVAGYGTGYDCKGECLDKTHVVMLEHTITKVNEQYHTSNKEIKGVPVCMCCLLKNRLNIGNPGYKVWGVVTKEDAEQDFPDGCFECGKSWDKFMERN